MYTVGMQKLVGYLGIFISIALILIALPLNHSAEAAVTCGETDSIKTCLDSIKAGPAVGAGLSTATNASDILVNVINWLLALVALLAMLALVWGGIMYIISLGDESRVGTAKKIILYAIIGIIIVLLSYVIISTVQSFLADPAKEALYLPGIPVTHAAGFTDGLTKLKSDIVDKEGSGLPGGDTSFLGIVRGVILYLLSFVSLIALAALIWGGIMYILSIGDEQRAAHAKRIILYAVIGIIIVLVSFTILTLVRTAITGPPGAGIFLINPAYAQGIPPIPMPGIGVPIPPGEEEGAGTCDKNTRGFAAGFACALDTATTGDISDLDPRTTVFRVISIMLILAAVIAVGAIIWGGVSYVLSLGEPDKASQAKRIIMYAIVGLIIIGLSVIVVNFVINLFR